MAAASTSFPSLKELSYKTCMRDPDTSLSCFIQDNLKRYSALCASFSERCLYFDCSELSSLFDPDKVCILTTGSDGREEKASRNESPIELILYINVKDKEQVKIISAKIEAYIAKKPHFFQILDIKSEESSLYKMLEKVMPARPLHAKFLLGTKENLEKYTIQTVREIRSISPKDLKKFRVDFCNSHLAQLKKCLEGTEDQSISFKNNTISYDGKNFKKRSTKYVALRVVQYNLDLIICNYLKEIPEEEAIAFLKAMPRTTHELIEFLYKRQVLQGLTYEEVKTLQKSYDLCLIYFHFMQNLYEASHLEVTLKLNDANMQKVRESLKNIQVIIQKIKDFKFLPIKPA
ncbi:MAG: hypothetical protein K1060chlam5_00804 [Candidatus Anoxychlamydiales bacterium]|nr:hypothetical protein [Candidatus Anoxychlamydiales bacterium]